MFLFYPNIMKRWRYDKPVLITEMGLKSSRGTWIKPYDYREERVLSLDHQSRAYEAMFSALSDRPWLKVSIGGNGRHNLTVAVRRMMTSHRTGNRQNRWSPNGIWGIYSKF
jgi:hypothetical protein